MPDDLVPTKAGYDEAVDKCERVCAVFSFITTIEDYAERRESRMNMCKENALWFFFDDPEAMPQQ